MGRISCANELKFSSVQMKVSCKLARYQFLEKKMCDFLFARKKMAAKISRNTFVRGHVLRRKRAKKERGEKLVYQVKVRVKWYKRRKICRILTLEPIFRTLKRSTVLLCYEE